MNRLLKLCCQHPQDTRSCLHEMTLDVPSYSPVLLAPSNTFADAASKSNPYSYSVSDAKNLLVSHG
jgi:hypothetical protein